jgi:hypothetical protein
MAIVDYLDSAEGLSVRGRSSRVRVLRQDPIDVVDAAAVGGDVTHVPRQDGAARPRNGVAGRRPKNEVGVRRVQHGAAAPTDITHARGLTAAGSGFHGAEALGGGVSRTEVQADSSPLPVFKTTALAAGAKSAAQAAAVIRDGLRYLTSSTSEG